MYTGGIWTKSLDNGRSSEEWSKYRLGTDFLVCHTTPTCSTCILVVPLDKHMERGGLGDCLYHFGSQFCKVYVMLHVGVCLHSANVQSVSIALLLN